MEASIPSARPRSISMLTAAGPRIPRGSGGMALKGQKCDGLDGIWRIHGTIKGAQIDTTATWIATLNGVSLLGTYTYKSVTKSYPGAVTTQTRTGRASIVAHPDGTLTMTMFGTTITATVVGFDTKQTVSIAIPDGQFSWAPGGSCP